MVAISWLSRGSLPFPGLCLFDFTMPLRIKVRQHGAYAVELATGDVELVDHEGNPIEFDRSKPVLALCRCGFSKKKPFCDGSHKECGLDLAILGAGPPPPTAPNIPV